MYAENHKTLMKEIKGDTNRDIYHIFGLKNEYCENDYNTKSNLQIQWNPYQQWYFS